MVKKLKPRDGSIGSFIIAIPSIEISESKTRALLKRVSKSDYPAITVGLIKDNRGFSIPPKGNE